MLMGEGWAVLAIPIIESYPVAVVYFVLAFFTVVLGMTNLILAVIVDKALRVHDEDLKREAEELEKQRSTAVDVFTDMCAAMDVDSNGSLDLDELKHGFATMPEFRNILAIMNISENDLEVLFHMMDKDASGDVSYVEFARQLEKVRSASVQTLLSFANHHLLQTKDMIVELSQRWKEHSDPTSNSAPTAIHSDPTALAEAQLPTATSIEGENVLQLPRPNHELDALLQELCAVRDRAQSMSLDSLLLELRQHTAAAGEKAYSLALDACLQELCQYVAGKHEQSLATSSQNGLPQQPLVLAGCEGEDFASRAQQEVKGVLEEGRSDDSLRCTGIVSIAAIVTKYPRWRH